MKTLDEMEKIARDIVVDRKTGSMTFEATTDLARALLAVLPVVRAAEAWADTNAESDTAETYQLVDAIISMRRKLGGS